MQDTIKNRFGYKLAGLRYVSLLIINSTDFQTYHSRNFGTDWGFLPSEDAVVIVDNHDVQRAANGVADHIIRFREARKHKQITSFMLAWPYGVAKVNGEVL